MCTDVNACSCTRGCTDTIRVCAESWLWGKKNPLPHQEIKPASVTCQSNDLPTELHLHHLNSSIISTACLVLMHLNAISADGEQTKCSNTRQSQQQLREHAVQITKTLIKTNFSQENTQVIHKHIKHHTSSAYVKWLTIVIEATCVEHYWFPLTADKKNFWQPHTEMNRTLSPTCHDDRTIQAVSHVWRQSTTLSTYNTAFNWRRANTQYWSDKKQKKSSPCEDGPGWVSSACGPPAGRHGPWSSRTPLSADSVPPCDADSSTLPPASAHRKGRKYTWQICTTAIGVIKDSQTVNPFKPCVPYLGCSIILLPISVFEKCYTINLFSLISKW